MGIQSDVAYSLNNQFSLEGTNELRIIYTMPSSIITFFNGSVDITDYERKIERWWLMINWSIWSITQHTRKLNGILKQSADNESYKSRY